MGPSEARKTALFPTLDADQIGILAEFGVEVALATGDAVFVEGEPVESFFVVIEGELLVTKRTAEGQSTMAVHKPGEFTGEISLLTGGLSPVSGHATQPSRVLRIERTVFNRLLTDCSPVAHIMLPAMASRLRDIETVAQQSSRLAALGKLAAGLAHELNNPAAAASRAAGQLRSTIVAAQALSMSLHDLAISAEGRQLLCELQEATPSAPFDPLAQADKEDELATWLDDHAVDDGWKLAPTFVAAGLDSDTMERIAAAVGREATGPVLAYLGSSLAINELVREVESSAGRISTLVKAVKDYSYMDQAPLQEVDLHQGLENTLTIMGHKLKKGSVRVERRYDTAIGQISAYGSELNQVWTNIIDNALDAMDGSGTLRIGTRIEGQCVEVEIGDSGPGIPPEVQERIFEPFFTTKPVGKGTGLGLDICYRIVVARHHGELTVASQPGDTRFTVRLPRTQE